MTLVSTIIRDAYRESNLIAISADPTDDEKSEGLSLLNRLLPSVYGTEAGEELDPIVIGRNNIDRPSGWPWYDQVPAQSEWFVPPNARLILNLTSPQTVWLNPNPQDGERFSFVDTSDNLATYNLTVDGNGRKIGAGFSTVVNTNGATAEYMYRADIGTWLKFTPLEADDTFPFPTEFDDLFVIGLAMRINPRNAVQADVQSQQQYTRLLRMFKARYRQNEEVGSEPGIVRTPGAHRGFYDNTRLANALFNSGYGLGRYGGFLW